MSGSRSINDLFNVNGLVALITGGGTGLGLYAARALDANGAKAVYIIGRRQEPLDAAAKTSINGRIIPLVGDVTDKKSLQAIAAVVRKEQGFLNLLFCNAGMAGPPHASLLAEIAPSRIPTIKEFQEAMLTPESSQFAAPFNLNCVSVFTTAMVFLDLLDAGNQRRNVVQDSQILITASVAGLSRHLAASFAYSTSKAAVIHLAKMLSTHFAAAKYGIRVNAFAPGMYPSEMTSGDVSQGPPVSVEDEHLVAFEGARKVPYRYSPAMRTGSEQDFGGAFLFLASAAGAYVDGDVLVTDGGRLSQYPAVY